MPDIVEFLTARLDEDERRYKRLVYGDTHWKMLRTSAHLGSWNYSRQNGIGIGVATNDALMDAGLERMRKTLDGWQRDHAKQWLAEVKAKRALIKLHSLMVTHGEGGGAAWYDRTTVCRTCDPPRQFPETAWPCLTVRHLAAVYAEHPDYKQEWSVE